MNGWFIPGEEAALRWYHLCAGIQGKSSCCRLQTGHLWLTIPSVVFRLRMLRTPQSPQGIRENPAASVCYTFISLGVKQLHSTISRGISVRIVLLWDQIRAINHHRKNLLWSEINDQQQPEAARHRAASAALKLKIYSSHCCRKVVFTAALPPVYIYTTDFTGQILEFAQKGTASSQQHTHTIHIWSCTFWVSCQN